MKTADRVRAYRKAHPEATIRQIQTALGLSSPSLVHWHLSRGPSKTRLLEISAMLRERRMCAKVAADLADNPQEIRLHAGEMTAQEMRTARALLRWVAHRIEARDREG